MQDKKQMKKLIIKMGPLKDYMVYAIIFFLGGLLSIVGIVFQKSIMALILFIIQMGSSAIFFSEWHNMTWSKEVKGIIDEDGIRYSHSFIRWKDIESIDYGDYARETYIFISMKSTFVGSGTEYYEDYSGKEYKRIKLNVTKINMRRKIYRTMKYNFKIYKKSLK